MHKRIGLTAGAAAIGLAAIAGCTSSGGSGNAGGSATGGNGGSGAVQLSPAAFIKAALTKASNDKTVHVKGTITSDGVNGTMDAQEQFSPSLAMSVTMNTSQFDISEILVGDTIYMKMPQLSSMLGGKPWAEFKLSAAGGSLGSTLQSLLDSTKNTDPTQQLQPLLASGDVHKVGTETVDGVQADHYSGTVDPATAFDSSAAAKNLTPDQIAQLKSLMKSSGITSETIDVWIATSDSLPVRESVSSSTSKSGAFKVDMHMSDWGKPVSITAPPADQVTDISSMMGSGSTS
jgi:hypothetical protein